eukprot:CAMPEP_0119465488 /NCGR_PEP_ID=MMETSP1344-20130328/595_1 /TAXON_ID=236787 /ORGANISM="Florenciella parvula, Strain CCMP2471" /LENGTH=77 /DNA_ID=CAMNT_0007497755 /DNA_START=42 /DNA_END=272 /DNA_ORIENTATION=+
MSRDLEIVRGWAAKVRVLEVTAAARKRCYSRKETTSSNGSRSTFSSSSSSSSSCSRFDPPTLAAMPRPQSRNQRELT